MSLLTQVLGNDGLQTEPDQIVAINNGDSTDINAFRQCIATIQNHLLLAGRREWLVYDSDPMLFTAALFAVLSIGARAIIPQNCQSKYIATLPSKKYGFVGHATDLQTDANVSTRDIRVDIGVRLKQFSHEDSRIGFCTSGSGGDPKIIYKNFEQLEAELRLFDRSWRANERTLFVSLVSHLHIYGFTFACLWPLLYKAPMLRYESPGILGALQQIPAHAVSVVDSVYVIAGPSAAKVAKTLGCTTDMHALCGERRLLPVRRLFSAGGMLSSADAANMVEVFDCPVTEVLGSTETSAIASRMRERNELRPPKWRALPGITICADGVVCGDRGQGALLAWGAHIGNVRGSVRDEAVASGDEIVIASDGSFDLAGRIDRICKVEGKRVSLDHIDNILLTHDLVCDAASFFAGGKKDSIAVLVELSKCGIELLQREGAESCDRRLRNDLLSYMEAIVVPKRYRYVKKIARNAQGKIPHAELKKLLARDTEFPIFPEILMTETAPSGVVLSLYIPPDLLYLKGHFHNYPVVPGFILLHWAVAFSATQLHAQADAAEIDKLKFNRPVQPCMEIKLSLRESADSIRFLYEMYDGKKFASGILRKKISN